MISEESCETEDCSNDTIVRPILNCNNCSQYCCYHCIFDQINAVLVSRRDFFQEKINLPKLMNGSVSAW